MLAVATVLTACAAAAVPRAAPIPTIIRQPAVRMVTPAIAPLAGVADDEAWIDRLDVRAFGADVRALGKRLASEEGEDDLRHFEKLRSWSNACGLLGVATMALPVNPITVVALSTWVYSRWAMIAHHTCHGGYDRHGDPNFRRRSFALGGPLRRTRDWLDWMLPEAWNLEHNVLHHYKLGEDGDPDLVERNLEFVRQWPFPMGVKLGFVAIMSAIWKWVYYAPNTYKQLKIAEHAKREGAPPEGLDPHSALTLGKLLLRPELRGGLFGPGEFLLQCFVPVVLVRFVLLPAPLLLLPGGPALYAHALANLALADAVSNVHAFVTIVTNHAGSDLYRFDTPTPPNSDEFFLRNVLSSANYRAGKPGTLGGDVNDFLHGWLNYQVEHHCWPKLSMLSYQRGAPELKAICERHGVPYTRESVFVRTKKTVDVMVGAASMRRWPQARLKVA